MKSMREGGGRSETERGIPDEENSQNREPRDSRAAGRDVLPAKTVQRGRVPSVPTARAAVAGA